jgi:hypothetical protein
MSGVTLSPHWAGTTGELPGDFGAEARGEYIAMSALLRVAAALCLLAGATGYSETTFQDVFGSGKDAPDETQVRTNQALTLPPDLSLKAPGTGTPPPPPPQPVQMASTATTQPPNYGAPAPGTTTASLTPAAPATVAAPAAPDAAAPGAAPSAPGAAPAAQPGQPPANQDVYERYGISKTKPDGTPKKQAELREELRQKYIEMQKAKNPNYGTILNMGSVWSDQ